MVGPFNFESIDKYNQTQQKVYIGKYRRIQENYNNLGILPPTFGSNYSIKTKSYNKSKIFSKKWKRKKVKREREAHISR